MNRDLLATVGFMNEKSEVAFRANIVNSDDGELCVTAGRLETFSPKDDNDQGIPATKAAIPNGPEPTQSATAPVVKTSLIRRLFGFGKKDKAANNPGTSKFSSPEVF